MGLKRKHYIYNQNYTPWGEHVGAGRSWWNPWKAICGICTDSVDWPTHESAVDALDFHVRITHDWAVKK